MGNEVLYAFTEPNYRTSVCFSKSMEGLCSELEKLRAELVELESPEALDSSLVGLGAKPQRSQRTSPPSEDIYENRFNRFDCLRKKHRQPAS